MKRCQSHVFMILGTYSIQRVKFTQSSANRGRTNKFFSPKELINYECASFLEPVNWSVSVSPRKYMLRIISYPYLSLSDLYSSLRFNMASPIAFRHGLKNAGRLTNLLSLTPKVCYLYENSYIYGLLLVLKG